MVRIQVQGAGPSAHVASTLTGQANEANILVQPQSQET